MSAGKILIVDDIKVNIQIVHRFLKKYNFEIKTAESGFEALDVIKTFVPDVVLMDICMPEMDGIETVLKIKEQLDSEFFIIFISALKDASTKRKAIDTGAINFFNKPVDLKLLLSTINKCLKTKSWNAEDLIDDADDYEKGSVNQESKKEATLYHFSKLKDLGQLSSSVAHDINNYLGGILGNVSLIELTTEDEEIRSYCAEIKRAVSSTSDLTESLTKYSKKEEPTSKTVDISIALTDALNLLNRDQRYIAEVKLNLTIESPLVDGVYSDFINIFLNLLKNAYQAVSEDGLILVSLNKYELKEPKEFHLHKLAAGSYYRVIFEDNGCGIEPELLKHIFEPFFTTKQEGTGLGLSSVARYVKTSGGAIDIKSIPGKGTKVILYFSTDYDKELSFSHEEPVQSGTLGLEGSRFVVMDDDVIFCNSLSAYLKKHKAQVTSFTDSSFNDFYEANRAMVDYDFLIIDFQSPYFNSLKLAEQLTKVNKHIQVCIISGSEIDTSGIERSHSFLKPISFPRMIKGLLDISKRQ